MYLACQTKWILPSRSVLVSFRNNIHLARQSSSNHLQDFLTVIIFIRVQNATLLGFTLKILRIKRDRGVARGVQRIRGKLDGRGRGKHFRRQHLKSDTCMIHVNWIFRSHNYLTFSIVLLTNKIFYQQYNCSTTR